MVREAEKDPRITGYSFEERHAAPMERMADTHIHYCGNPEDLECLVKSCAVTNIELMLMLCRPDCDGSDPVRWMKEVGDAFEIGKNAIPFVSVNLHEPDPDEVTRARDMGFWGLKIIGPIRPYDDPFYTPLFDRAEELGLGLVVHTGVLSTKSRGGAGMSLMRADSMDTLAKRHNTLQISGAHLGCPDISTAIWASQFCPNLIWDCSGGCRFHVDANPLILHAAMHGRPKTWKSICFGTDCVRGLYPPEWADGWGSKIEHRLAQWQHILDRLPVPPTSEQLDGYFYQNARDMADRLKKGRDERGY